MIGRTDIQRITAILALGFGIILSSCNPGKNEITEGPTRGNIVIGADESFQMLTEAEIATFMSIYHYAVIKPKFKPEADIVADLLNDSVRMVIISRDLTPDERDRLMAGKVIARAVKIAYDGVALVLNKSNPDSNLRYDQVGSIMDGTLTRWDQVNPGNGTGDIRVVFDHTKSGNFRYIREKFLGDRPAPPHLYAVNNNPEVLNYVKQHPGAIGVIGVNWISDKDDTTSHRFLKAIRIAGIGAEGDTEGTGEFRKPYQGYLAEASYPFTREVYALNRESFTGLGTGFVQFIAGDIGQRIVLKSGLVPATMPIRLVEVK